MKWVKRWPGTISLPTVYLILSLVAYLLSRAKFNDCNPSALICLSPVDIIWFYFVSFPSAVLLTWVPWLAGWFDHLNNGPDYILELVLVTALLYAVIGLMFDLVGHRHQPRTQSNSGEQ